jgi:hypothetical protein
MICIYYLQKINQCGIRYQELERHLSNSLKTNQQLNNHLQKMDNDLNSMDTLETYVNYPGNNPVCSTSPQDCGPSPDELAQIDQYNKNIDINPVCTANTQYNPQAPPNRPSYSEIVTDNCSIPKTQAPLPIVPVNPEIKKQEKKLECNIKEAELYIQKGIEAMKKIKLENEERQQQPQCISQGPNPNYELNSVNYPLIGPCYDAYKRCIKARAPNLPYYVDYSKNNLERDIDAQYNRDLGKKINHSEDTCITNDLPPISNCTTDFQVSPSINTDMGYGGNSNGYGF